MSFIAMTPRKPQLMRRLGPQELNEVRNRGLAGGYGCVYALERLVNMRESATNEKDSTQFLTSSYRCYELEETQSEGRYSKSRKARNRAELEYLD